jgi:hypothetical protein
MLTCAGICWRIQQVRAGEEERLALVYEMRLPYARAN